jgi:ribosomal protein S8
MTKKLVITANMGSAESVSAAPSSVTYQWHWRRIVLVGSVLLIALAIVAYSFLGAVNAEQSEQQTQQEASLATETDLSRELDELPRLEHNAEQAKAPATISLQDEPSSLINTQAQTDLQQQSDSPQVTAQAVEVESDQNDDVLASVDETPPEISEPKGEAQPEVVQNKQQFAQTAHIASVAIGAKIDTDKVSRAVLTTDVVDREPVNVLKSDVKLLDISQSLSFFSELKNMQGQTVRHVWYYQNQQLASIELAISSPRFRTYSTKNIMPEQVGDWRVEVIDTDGNLLAQKEFRILAD